MWRVWGRTEIRTRFWWGNLKGVYHLEHLGVERTIIFKDGSEKKNERTTGFANWEKFAITRIRWRNARTPTGKERAAS
jgi:hypothetical protein